MFKMSNNELVSISLLELTKYSYHIFFRRRLKRFKHNLLFIYQIRSYMKGLICICTREDIICCYNISSKLKCICAFLFSQTMSMRRKQLTVTGKTEVSTSTPATPHHPGYAPNAAFHAIKRHALEFVNPKELMVSYKDVTSREQFQI